jgi:arylsulfatase A-like enzyme
MNSSIFRWLMSTVVALVFVSVHDCSAQTEKPKRNVLLIMTDDCNCDLGCYGHELVQTPNIDLLASKGMRFLKAYCQYPVCNPSRASMMTGLYPDQTGVLSNGQNFRNKLPDVVTLPQMFRGAGYWAGRVGKIYHYNVPMQIGEDGMDDPASWDTVVNPRGIDREVHSKIATLQKGKFGGTLSWLNLPSEPEEHTDGKVALEAVKLLEEHHPEKTGQPFFLAVGFFRPHTPFVAPPKYFDKYPVDRIEPVVEQEGDRDDIPLAAQYDRPKQRELTIKQRKEIIQAYYASISLMDEQLGHVVNAIDRLGLRDNTTIVFVSDHGYHLGAHGLWQKGDLFEGSSRVPMIISDPRFSNAKSTQSLAGLIDLYPTLAELTGVKPPRHILGSSLVPILKDESAIVNSHVQTVSVSRARWAHRDFTKKKVKGYSIRTNRYRYTQWGDGEYGHELYDYQTDPGEISNLADKSEYAQTVKDLHSRLQSAVKYSH